MSRGPGRVEKKIAGVFMANPEKAFSTGMLCKIVWPELLWPEGKHRSSVLRAAGKVAARLGWVQFPIYHLANETCFISTTNPLAGTAAKPLHSIRMIAAILNVSERTIRRDLAKPADGKGSGGALGITTEKWVKAREEMVLKERKQARAMRGRMAT
jgi:hypothetical protein